MFLRKPILERGLAVFGSSDHHLTGRSDFLFLDHHVVAVGDLGFDHRVTADLQHELIPFGEHFAKIDPLLLFYGFVQYASGHQPGQR